MIGKTNIASGGSKIDGIIKEYKVYSENNVSTGDFVRFINKYGNATQIKKSTLSYFSVSAAALSENKVFVSYENYGVICTISGDTITAGTSIAYESSYTPELSYVTALSENKVFVAYCLGSYQYLYGVVCTIDGTTITKGTNTSIDPTNYISSSTIAISTLDDDKVFILYGSSNDSNYNKLYAVVCSVNETTITKGTPVKISSSTNSSLYNSLTAIDSARVFIAYNGSNVFYGGVATISGTTISKSKVGYKIVSSVKSNSVTALSENKVFAAYVGSDSYLYGIICPIVNIDGFTTGQSVQLTNSKAGAFNNSGIYSVTLTKSEVFINYKDEQNREMYMTFATIAGIDIKPRGNSSSRLDNFTNSMRISATTLSYNRVFSCCNMPNGDKYVYGIVGEIQVAPVTTLSHSIYGVANTSGTAGDNIKVTTPNFN